MPLIVIDYLCVCILTRMLLLLFAFAVELRYWLARLLVAIKLRIRSAVHSLLRTCAKCKSSGSNSKFAFIIPTLDRTHTNTHRETNVQGMPEAAPTCPPARLACLLAAYPAAFVRLIKQISVFNDSFPGSLIAFELLHTHTAPLPALPHTVRIRYLKHRHLP